MSDELLPYACWGCGKPARRYPFDEINESYCCANKDCTIRGEVYEKKTWNARARHSHESAKRISELEAECEHSKHLISLDAEIIERIKAENGRYREIDSDLRKKQAELEAENAKLRKALKFYADGNHYETVYPQTRGQLNTSKKVIDDGEVARKALGDGK